MRTLILIALTACAPVATVVETTDLPDNVQPTGVTVAPDGALWLSSDVGLWRHDGDWTLAMPLERLTDAVDWIDPDITDLAALPDGQIAFTVPGIGLLFNPSDDTVIQHFCYEPGWGDWEIQEQRTHTLSYDTSLGLLVSQPQTSVDGVPERTDVADFDPVTGIPVDWHTLRDSDFLATGLAARDGDLVLAQGHQLYDWRRGDDRPTKRQRVSLAGEIQGLTWSGDDLLVLDADAIHTLR